MQAPARHAAEGTFDPCVPSVPHRPPIHPECSTVEALQAATLHPAQLLGLKQRKGTLDVGADADLVVLDDDLNVRATFVRGGLVYKV